MKRLIRIIIRLIIWLPASLLLLAVLLVAALQTQTLKEQLARIAERQAAKYLSATLHIGKLEGNFGSGIALSEVTLTNQTDTLARMGRLELHYRLWPLLTRAVQIDSLVLTGFHARLVQLPDSSWNVEHLLKENADTTTSAAPGWAIDLKKVLIANSSVRIVSSDSILPRAVDRIAASLSGYYGENRRELQLDSLAFRLVHPDLTVKNLQFNVKQEKQLTTLTGFRLTTAFNQLEGNGSIDLENGGETSVSVRTAPICPDEFSFFVPDLRLAVTPQLSGDAQLKNDSLAAFAELRYDEQKIRLTIRSAGFGQWLQQPAPDRLNYRVETELEKVDLYRWTGNANLNCQLNGRIAISGEGIDPAKMNARATAALTDSRLWGYAVKNLDSEAGYQSATLETSLRAATPYGRLEGHGVFVNLAGRPTYRVKLATQQLNLAPLLGIDSLYSKLNAEAEAAGTGFDPETLTTAWKLRLAPSELMAIPIDTGYLETRYEHQQFTIDSLSVANRSAAVDGSGILALAGQWDLKCSGSVRSLEAFSRFTELPELAGSGTITARLTGKTDSLQIEANADLDPTTYLDYYLRRAHVSCRGTISAADTVFEVRLSGQQLGCSLAGADSITIESRIFTDSLIFESRVAGASWTVSMGARMNWKNQLRLAIESLAIDAPDQSWHLDSTANFTLDPVNYTVEHFRLLSDREQRLEAKGLISREGSENFDLKLENIDLAAILQTTGTDAGVAGKLNLDLSLTGTARAPLIDGAFRIDSADIAGYTLAAAEGQLSYRAQTAHLNSDWRLAEQGHFTATATIPVALNLQTFDSSVAPDAPVLARIDIADLPLTLIRAFVPAKEIDGIINGELKIDGTIGAPHPNGFLRLNGGRLVFPEYGINYHDMEIRTSVNNEVVSLDSLGIRSHDGMLTGQGKLVFESEFYNGKMKDSNIKIEFKKFNPIDHKQINMQVNGLATLTGSRDAVVFGGDLEIPQSEINLPTLFSLFGKVYTPEVPPSILMRELEKLEPARNGSPQPKANENSSAESSYFDRLTGKLKLSIPKNTWIKNPSLRIEISGDLEVVKNGSYPEIFGTVQVVRGQYELFGRTFIVSEGTIDFQGGEEINPTVSLTAAYTMKSQTAGSQVLKLVAEGKALNPTLSFTLNGESITEGDALAYIVFGRPLSELTSGSEQSTSTDNSTEAKAKAAAASMLASQLTKFLGKSLNVDYIEVKSKDDFGSGSLEVGKYITNDLFISWEQQFGNTTDADLSRYEVRLEYELLKFLFLQLNNSTNESGFDILFKIRLK